MVGVDEPFGSWRRGGKSAETLLYVVALIAFGGGVQRRPKNQRLLQILRELVGVRSETTRPGVRTIYCRP